MVGFEEDLASSAPMYETLIFDLDDTLYPLSSGLAEACRLNIEAYMVEKLYIHPALVSAACGALYKNYGTTMAGLSAEGFSFDHDEYHEYVHGRLPYHNLHPDPVLRDLLRSMPQRKFIFTNADKAHADKVLKALGLEDVFEGIICFGTFNSPAKDIQVCQGANDDVNIKFDTSVPIVCKPAIECFQEAIQLMQLNPSKTLFFDDSARNIFGGKTVGLQTVLVGSFVKCDGADHTIVSIHNLKESIPQIWAQPRFIGPLHISHEFAVESVA